MADTTSAEVIPLFGRRAEHEHLTYWADVIESRDGYVVGEVGMSPLQWETIQILKNNPDLYIEAIPGGFALRRVTGWT